MCTLATCFAPRRASVCDGPPGRNRASQRHTHVCVKPQSKLRHSRAAPSRLGHLHSQQRPSRLRSQRLLPLGKLAHGLGLSALSVRQLCEWRVNKRRARASARARGDGEVRSAAAAHTIWSEHSLYVRSNSDCAFLVCSSCHIPCACTRAQQISQHVSHARAGPAWSTGASKAAHPILRDAIGLDARLDAGLHAVLELGLHVSTSAEQHGRRARAPRVSRPSA